MDTSLYKIYNFYLSYEAPRIQSQDTAHNRTQHYLLTTPLFFFANFFLFARVFFLLRIIYTKKSRSKKLYKSCVNTLATVQRFVYDEKNFHIKILADNSLIYRHDIICSTYMLMYSSSILV